APPKGPAFRREAAPAGLAIARCSITHAGAGGLKPNASFRAKYRTMRAFGLTALRLAVAAVFIAHGAQKLFGVWGGPGLNGTMAMVKGLGLPIPYPPAITALGVLLGLSEFLGGVFLALGVVTRWAALALLVDMGVAVWKVHYPNGFF